jgi:exodeoxyribonuclease VII small subunit
MTPVTNLQDEPISFEAALEQIRTIVTELESGELSLEESIEKYRAGSSLIEGTRKLIAEAELRVTELGTTGEAL